MYQWKIRMGQETLKEKVTLQRTVSLKCHHEIFLPPLKFYMESTPALCPPPPSRMGPNPFPVAPDQQYLAFLRSLTEMKL